MDADESTGVGGDLGFVGHQDHGVALGVEGVEEGHDFVAGAAVEVAGGLVGQQDGGVVGQGAGDGYALALSPGQLGGAVGHSIGQADALQGFGGALRADASAHAAVKQGELDVVQGGGAGQQVEGLEDEADLTVADVRQLAGVHVGDVGAGEAVGARCRRVEAADDVHQGGLAGSGRSHDGQILVLFHRQVGAAERLHYLDAALVSFGDLVQFEQHFSLVSSSGYS